LLVELADHFGVSADGRVVILVRFLLVERFLKCLGDRIAAAGGRGGGEEREGEKARGARQARE
jgi:hypothetical protein